MAQPSTTILAAQTYREVKPLDDGAEDRGWPLLYFIEGTAQMAKEIEDLVRDSDEAPGWSVAVDINRAPERLLEWLAQFNGVGPNKGLPADDYRQQIRDAEGQKRGRPSAMIAAAKPHLTGTKTVILRERDGTPGRITLITYTSETPDAAAVCNAVRRAKPAGLVLTCEVVDGWTIEEMEAAYAGQTIADLEGDFDSIHDLESRIPA